MWKASVLLGQVVQLLVILHLAHAGYSRYYMRNPKICGRPKCPPSQKFNYTPHMKYEYSYSTEIKSMFDGAGTNSSDLYLNAVFNLQFRSECEGVLQVVEAEIRESETSNGPSGHLQEAFSKHLLRFYFDNGKITELCPSVEEPVWILNLKKGMLSAIQNGMDRFDVDQHVWERDVNGDCVTSYFFKEVNSTTLIIEKKKELSTCTHRHQFYSIIPTSAYIFQHRYHKWSPINSNVSCLQSIDHKILTKIVCKEEHAYQPFYNQTNGAKTSARLEIVLLSEEAVKFEDEEIQNLGKVEKRDNLLFDHRKPVRATRDDLFECKELLTSMCTLTMDTFQPEFPDMFSRFIHIARHLSTTALNKLYQESTSLCPTGKKHILDALPYIRSRASTYVMTEVIVSKEIPLQIVHEWLMVMAFFPRPDAETIDSVSKLMYQDDVDLQTLLTVSTMVHTFCDNTADCQEQESVLRIMEVIEKVFNSTCINLENQSKAISALKALGNAGVVTPSMEYSLQKCIENKDLSIQLRTSAIDSHRRLPCTFNRDFMLGIFENITYDQELRIASYLQIMKCPSYSILRSVKHVLDTEEYNQASDVFSRASIRTRRTSNRNNKVETVGSFIWSHLRNQMKSSMPSRVEIQAMLQDEHLSNKFNKDIRKFSKNYESSFYLNTYGIGGFQETNVIFSPKSFLPRSVTTNVTINLFGETINVFEISLYLEGFERYLEKWLKNNEIINKEKFYNVFQNLRVMRDVPGALKSLVDEIGFAVAPDDGVQASVSFKMFGNELKYYTIKGDAELQDTFQNMNPMKIIKDFLSGQEVKFERSTMLIDTSYTTPMAVGIPLKINIVGTASINVNAMGYVDASKFSSHNELEIDGKLKPSIGMSFEGSMVVDTFLVETGVKFKGTVFTSTALEGTLIIKGYKYVRVSFNLPMQKSDIFHAETKLILIKRGEEVLIEGITAGRVENRICTWSVMDETIGLKFCTNSLLPNTTLLMKSPLFLFSGPLKFGISLEKSDPTAKKYIVEYKVETNTTTNKTIFTFKFETPGSETKRGMKAVIDLDTQSQNLTLAYQSTLSQVQAQGFYRNTPQEKSVNFGLDINGKKHIDIQVGVDITEGKYGFTYSPRLLFAINNKRIAELSGSIKWVDKGGVSQCDIHLDFKTNRFATIIGGYVRKNDVSIATNIKMDYQLGTARQETVRVELKLGDRSSKFLSQFYGNLQIESTAYPQINLVTSLKYQSTQGHIECKVDMQTNPYVTDDSQKLYVQWGFQYFKTYVGSKVNTSLEVTKPSSDIDIRIGLSHQDSPGASSSTTVIAKYATGKEIVITLDLTLPHTSMFYFESRLKVTLHVPANQMSIFFKVHEKSQKEYDIEFAGSWFSGHNLTVKGMYQDRSTLVLTSHSLKLLARSELFKDILFTGRFIISEEEYKTDLLAEHNEIRYGLIVRHFSKGPGLYESYGEIRFNKSSYSATNYIDLIKRQTILELHLDQYRDIHIALRGLTNKTMLDAGLDLKWDANRDPSQKLVCIILTNSHGNLNFNGKGVLEYPGRIMTATYLVQHKGADYTLYTQAEWSPKEGITMYLHGIYNIPENGYAKIDGKLSTPFRKWQYTALNYEIQLEEQGIKSLGSVSWINNQKVNFELSFNYQFSEGFNSLNFISSLNSSIPEINTMYAILKHSQREKEYDTEFAVQLSPTHLIVLTSAGYIKELETMSRYVLLLSLRTPFPILERASISADLTIYIDRKFRGNLHIVGNGKKYATTVEGSVKTLNESRFSFHIATPIEKYKLITGRFVYSAQNKHLIAEVKGPVTSIGVEVLYVYHNFSYFDMKLRVHTSITVVNSLLVVGKINFETVDLRFGWNALLVGLIGSSHYKSWDDVDYSLQLFTPVEGFHTCSVIAKLIFKDRIDFETSVKVAEKKIGLMVQGMVKPDVDFALPVRTIKYLNSSETENSTSDEQPSLELEEPEYGDVYLRGVLQLHSLFYPTVHIYTQINEDHTEIKEYYLSSYFNFPFCQMKLRDDLSIENVLTINNKLNVTTTCDVLKDLSSIFTLRGTSWKNIRTHLNVQKTSYNETLDGDMEIAFSHSSIGDSSSNWIDDGVYDFFFKIVTPFPMISYCKANLTLLAEKNAYESNVSVTINNASLSADGSLEIDYNYLESNVGLKVNSSYFLLPMSRIKLLRDFTDMEKKFELGVALPNEKGDGLVNYGIGGTWHYDGPNYMKYIVRITTPYDNIGVISSSLEYKSDPEKENYFVEVFSKYSETSEIMIKSKVNSNRFIFQIDSTFESFRHIFVNSTIKTNGAVRTLEAVLSSDKEHRMLGWATITPHRPLMVEVKLFKTKTNSEILSFIINISRKESGFDLSALIQQHGQKIHINGDWIKMDLGKKLNVLITSTYPGYESLNLDAVLLSEDLQALVSKLSMELSEELPALVSKLSMDIKSKWVTTNILVDLNLLLGDTSGVLESSLRSPLLSGNAQIVWLSDFKETIDALLDMKGEYSYSEVTKTIGSNLHFWGNRKDALSIGGEIDFNNQDWWFTSNATVIYPPVLSPDVSFTGYLLLPHNKDDFHKLLGKLYYKDDYSFISHLIDYSAHPDNFAFKTLSEISFTEKLSKGTILLETGNAEKKHRFFDTFTAKPVDDKFIVDNLLQSTNMNEDLSINLEYQKPHNSHQATIDVCYPPTVNILAGYVDFTAVNNMYAKMNCSTPFEAFPYVKMFLDVVTNKTLYLRYAEILWPNNSALFNYTHASKITNELQITDGNVLVEFPLTTRHIGNLNYKYESTESFADGRSYLMYNGDTIMSGNYSRKTQSTKTDRKEEISIQVNNSFVPIDIMYLNELKKKFEDSVYPFTVIKRVEVFKLNDKHAFNLIGEMEVFKNVTDKQITLKALHDQRKLVIETFYEGQDKLTSKVNFTLRPKVWAESSVILLNKAGTYGQELEFNISYPRRLFTLLGEYEWTDYELNSEITIFPNQYRNAKSVGANVHWKQISVDPDYHIASLVIFHPTFNKNLTLNGVYIRNGHTPLDLDLELEYSTDLNRKLSMNAVVEKKSDLIPRFYEINATGIHPASRLKLTVFGVTKLHEGVLELNKNITYKRSYLPLQFWSTDMKVDIIKNIIEIQRHSLRDSGYIFATYGKRGAIYVVDGKIANGNDLNMSGNLFLDSAKCQTQLLLNFTPDAAEQMHMDGKYEDHRRAVMNVWRTYDGLTIKDFSFFAFLNYSRMINSKIAWRPNIRSDIMILAHNTSNYVWFYAVETINFWTQYMKAEISDSVMDVWYDAKPILQDFIDDMRDVRYLQQDLKLFKKLVNECYEANEFYMQDIYGMYLLLAEEMAFRDKMSHVPKIVNELWEIMGETGETIRQSILWVVESLKKFYDKLAEFFRALMSGETVNQISQFIQKLAGKYDKMIKEMHISFLHYMEHLWSEASDVISHYWTKYLRMIEPTFIQIAHYIESVFWEGSKKTLEFLYERQSELLNSTVFIKNAKLTQDLDKFYKDLTKNDFLTNLRKYSAMFLQVIQEKYFNFVPFGYELNEIGSEIVGEMKELYKLPLVNFTIQTTQEVYSQMIWVYNYLNIGEKVQRIVPMIYQTMIDLSRTALENEMINHEGRTKFIFDPEKGIIKLEQKLPMPWHAFNETPNFEEIPEYKMITSVQKWLAPSNETFWTYYYHYVPMLDPSNWLPPFRAQAIISAGQHFKTFDNRHFEFKASCSYLLAKDYVNNTFSLVLRHEHSLHTLVLLVDEHVIVLDLMKDEVRVEREWVRSLPVQVGQAQVYREEGVAVVTSDNGFTLKCNFKYDVCSLTLSGWYFGKTAGLLGTMDNEPYNDFLTSTGIVETDVTRFVESWALGSCQSEDVSGRKPLNTQNTETCMGLFNSKASAFTPCYPAVDPMPYNLMCQRSLPGIDSEICSSAFAYVKACEFEHTPLRIPSFCARCRMSNGSSVEEGDLEELEDNVAKSTDVVFIIEAKKCNQYMRERKIIYTFVSILTKEFENVGIKDNRYAVVTFGGDGVFNSPRNIYVNNQFFTSDKNIPHYFENIPSGNGSRDIFGALRYTSQLQFRPGVSKTFILIPCSDCDPSKMTIEYSVLNQAFIEKDITLHILMNAEFDLEKLRVNKMFYGLDSRRAYTKNDFKSLKGDEDLRRQIKLTKTMLGYCTPLALETNGTIFTGKKLGSESTALVKKFSSVFARRIALTAEPDPCQTCECAANSNGIQFVECFPCYFPTPAVSEFDFKENSTLSLFHAFESFGDNDFNF